MADLPAQLLAVQQGLDAVNAVIAQHLGAPPAPLNEAVGRHGFTAPIPATQPFAETANMQRIAQDAGRKSCDLTTVESLKDGKMIISVMKGNFTKAVQCTVGVPRATFYTDSVDLSKVSNDSKKDQWCHFMGSVAEEMDEQKDLLAERRFYCTMVDKLVDIFSTDRNPSDARHSFEHLKQTLKEALWDYVIRATTLAAQARKPLFSDVVVLPRDVGDYSDNLTRVINGIHNAEVRNQMLLFLPSFIERVPSQATFKNRLRSVVLTQRNDLVQRQVKERKLIVGLRFEAYDDCLTEMIEHVEVEGGEIAMVSGGYGAGNVREKAGPHNMGRHMLCQRCGKGYHQAGSCPAKVGEMNSGGHPITTTPEEFMSFRRQYFDQQFREKRERGTFNGYSRGGATAGRGRGSGGRGRGGFNPRRQTVNAVSEYEEQQDGDYDAVEEEQYEEDQEVVANINSLALNE